jgi:hypothetical protein
MRPIQTRADLRPQMPTPVNAVADKIAALLREELHDTVASSCAVRC